MPVRKDNTARAIRARAKQARIIIKHDDPTKDKFLPFEVAHEQFMQGKLDLLFGHTYAMPEKGVK